MFLEKSVLIWSSWFASNVVNEQKQQNLRNQSKKAGEKVKKLLIGLLFAIGMIIVLYRTDIFTGNLTFWKNKSELEVNQQIAEIEIDTKSVETTIIPEQNRDTVEVDFSGLGGVTLKKHGKKIVIKEKQHWFPIKWHRKLHVYIPADFNRNLTANMTSGKFIFSHQAKMKPFALAKLNVQMSSGMIRINNLSVEQLQLGGSSGKMIVDTVTANKGTVRFSSGHVSLARYIGELEAELSSGKLDVDIAQLQAPLKIEASSGQVDVKLPDHAHFTLTGHTGSGKIICDYPLQNQLVENKKMKGTYGTGEHPVDLKISSGLIQVH